VDKRDLPGGQRNWEWIKKGVPLRLEIGPRDIEQRTVMVARRDRGAKAKEPMQKEELIQEIADVLGQIQTALLEKATALRDAYTQKLETLEEFKAYFTPQNEARPESHGGFALMHWAGTAEDEDRLSKEFKTTIRCIPLGDQYAEEGTCFLTGKPSHRRVVFAKSY
jgi:prolyl-tRNA synthetase